MEIQRYRIDRLKFISAFTSVGFTKEEAFGAITYLEYINNYPDKKLCSATYCEVEGEKFPYGNWIDPVVM